MINISNGSQSLTSDTHTLCQLSVHVTSHTFPRPSTFHTASLGRPGYKAKIVSSAICDLYVKGGIPRKSSFCNNHAYTYHIF